MGLTDTHHHLPPRHATQSSGADVHVRRATGADLANIVGIINQPYYLTDASIQRKAVTDWGKTASPLSPSSNENRIINASGLWVFLDQGSDINVILAKSLAGQAGVISKACDPVPLGGALAGHTTTKTATFTLSVFFSQEGDDDLHDMLGHPTPREYGGLITAHVVDAPNFGAAFPQNTDMILSDRPAYRSSISDIIWDHYTLARKGRRVWTHLLQLSKGPRGQALGTSNVVGFSATSVTDVFEDDATASPLRPDGALADARPTVYDPVTMLPPLPLLERIADDPATLHHGQVDIPLPPHPHSLAALTRDEVAAIITPRLGDIGQRYPDLFIDIFFAYQAVLRPFRGGSAIRQLHPRVKPGTVPARSGLFRKPPPAMLPALRTEYKRLVDANAMEKTTLRPSLFINATVNVFRPDGRIRSCIDAREINKAIQGTTDTELPLVRDHIMACAAADLLTGLDATEAFQQLGIDEEARDMFGVALPNEAGVLEYFRYTVLVYGLLIAPGIYQDFMQDTIEPAATVDPLTTVPAYIDNCDIATRARNHSGPVIPGSEQERDLVRRHVAVLRIVVAAFAQAGITISVNKSHIGTTKLKTMGVIVGLGHYTLDQEKVDGFRSFLIKPPRLTVQWLRRLLGALNSIRDLMGSRYVTAADPFFTLLRRSISNKTHSTRQQDANVEAAWTPAHDDALRELVALVRDDSSIAMLRPDRPAYAQMDASDAGLGGGVGQYGDDGLFYNNIVFNHRFTDNQRRWSVGARELFGWLKFLRLHWRMLVGLTVVYRGDHLNHLAAEDMDNTHCQRWMAELCCFSVWMQQFQQPNWTARIHTPGVCISLCDFLSRNAPPNSFLPEGGLAHLAIPDTLVVRRTSVSSPGNERDARTSNMHTSSFSPWMRKVADAQALITNTQRDELLATGQVTIKHTDLGDLLYVGPRVLIPEQATDVTSFIFKQAHDRQGHASPETVMRILNDSRLHIPNFRKRFMTYYESCTCQTARSPSTLQAAGRFLIKPTMAPLEHIYADFFHLLETPVPNSSATYAGIVIIMDARSRITAIENVTEFTAEAFLEAYRSRWRPYYGIPRRLSTDGGRHFDNHAVADAMDSEGVDHDIGTPHHHRGRGVVERAGGRVKNMLRRILKPGHVRDWPDLRDEIQWLLNSLPHSGLGGISPLQYLFATAPHRRLSTPFATNTDPQSVEDRLAVLGALRFFADACSDSLVWERASDSWTQLDNITFKINDYILLFYPTLEHAMAAGYYRGPFVVTRRDKTSDFYVVQEVLANGGKGTPVRTHVSRMISFDMTRLTPEDIHQDKLPHGFYVVRDVIDGPRADDGKFQCTWYHTDLSTWEPHQAIISCTAYRNFCSSKGIDYVTGTVAEQPLVPVDDTPAAGTIIQDRRDGRPQRASVAVRRHGNLTTQRK